MKTELLTQKTQEAVEELRLTYHPIILFGSWVKLKPTMVVCHHLPSVYLRLQMHLKEQLQEFSYHQILIMV